MCWGPPVKAPLHSYITPIPTHISSPSLQGRNALRSAAIRSANQTPSAFVSIHSTRIHNMSITSYILSYGAAVLGVASVAAYIFFTRKFGHWKKKGIKHLNPLPFVGNFKDVALLRKNIGILATDIYEEHKHEPFIGLFAFYEPVLQIHDLNLLKAVLVKDFQIFCDRSGQADEDIDPLIARGLFVLNGDRWKHARTAITPSFTSGKMKRMYELVADCGKLLVSTIEKEKCIGKPIAVYELAARYTTDVIASCAFGIQGNTLSDSKAEFRRILRLTFDFGPVQAILLAFIFFAPRIYKAIGLKVIPLEVENFVRNTIRHTIKNREEQNIQRHDLLDSLIQLNKFGSISESEEHRRSPSYKEMNFGEEDICGHSFSFLTAGFETSATTVSYALFELARNEEVQDKLREELRENTNDGTFSYEVIHSMKYLDMVLQETLRKYPPLPFLDRISNKAYTLPGTNVTLEAGSRIMVPVLGLHMNPDYHPNPKKFVPERFSDENKKNILNYSYIPFGEGPRACVGMRFALMQTKSFIAHLLIKYTVHQSNKTPREIKYNTKTILLQPKDPIELILNPVA